MNKDLLIESSDPFQGNGGEFCRLARDLAANGNEVVLLLVQNAVLAARAGAQTDAVARAASAGVSVVADDFSLRERGIDSGRLKQGVAPASIDLVVDKLAEGYRALWH
jgi:intracellular sulfur oxidation DsrE/DsrF family protein